jgi:dihydroorotate dehydrogenase
MSWWYRGLIRPVLFAQESEIVHNRTLRALSFASRHGLLRGALRSCFAAPRLPVGCLGLKFPNPVGLAAGMDKQAQAVPAWAALGFGFAELGGVTWKAQPGNPAPRMFRAIADGALINRMGFNNPGAEEFARTAGEWRQLGLWPKHPVGVNLGKSKDTPLEGAAEDYCFSFKLLRAHFDFFVVNVSSPNTPGLRSLQDKSALDEILAAIQSAQQAAAPAKPILVKIAPDLTFEAMDEILELAASRNIAGIVATNTTISRPESRDAACRQAYSETGGLSGKPLRARSTEVIRHLFRQTQGKLPIIGVGGIFSSADAWEKIVAGASLVQIYTGLVFEGPGLARAIVRGLQARLTESGMNDISKAVGTGA